MTSVSVLLLTLDEELHLPACLESLRWSDDVHVLDSGSTDRTVEIARHSGAQVHFHAFENFSAQRNWALAHLPFRHDWLFVIDADERVPVGLAEEMLAAVRQAPPEVAGFEMRRKVFFLDREIKHAGQYAVVWFLRLFRPRAARYEDRKVNAYPLLNGQVRRLHAALVHDNRKGATELVAKFNRYATLEAEETLRLQVGSSTGLRARLRGSPPERRRWWKHLAMRLPGRALLKFNYIYFWRRGFLDGAPGFLWCVLLSSLEVMSTLKAGARRRGLPD